VKIFQKVGGGIFFEKSCM